MKRLILTLYLALLALTLCACSGGSTPSWSSPSPVVQDDSYDVNKLYGRWLEEGGDRVLIITSQSIRLTKGSSSSSTSSKIETTKDTVNISISDLREMKIEEKDDGTIRISNDSVAFVLKENWSEADVDRTAAPKDVAMNEKIQLDFTELQFTDSSTEKEIKVSSTTGGGGGSGGHITMTQIIAKEESGKKHILVKGTIKNLAAYPVSADEIKTKIVVNGKYEFDSDVDVVTDGADRIHSMDPLNTANIYIHAPIDASAASDITSLDLYIGFEQAFSGNDSGDPAGSRYYYHISVK